MFVFQSDSVRGGAEGMNAIPPSEGGRIEKVHRKQNRGSGVMRDSAPRSSDGMAPPSDGGPSEAESQNRRIPPTPVCRDEVGLTSWLGKPLHLPARREQVWVLRLTLEFRMLPCIRGCRLTGLVTSRISGCIGG